MDESKGPRYLTSPPRLSRRRDIFLGLTCLLRQDCLLSRSQTIRCKVTIHEVSEKRNFPPSHFPPSHLPSHRAFVHAAPDGSSAPFFTIYLFYFLSKGHTVEHRGRTSTPVRPRCGTIPVLQANSIGYRLNNPCPCVAQDYHENGRRLFSHQTPRHSSHSYPAP